VLDFAFVPPFRFLSSVFLLSPPFLILLFASRMPGFGLHPSRRSPSLNLFLPGGPVLRHLFYSPSDLRFATSKFSWDAPNFLFSRCDVVLFFCSAVCRQNKSVFLAFPHGPSVFCRFLLGRSYDFRPHPPLRCSITLGQLVRIACYTVEGGRGSFFVSAASACLVFPRFLISLRSRRSKMALVTETAPTLFRPDLKNSILLQFLVPFPSCCYVIDFG